MLKRFFDSPERVAQLVYHAGLWRDTPWMANSEVRGVGVSCHNLPIAVYKACGFLAKDFAGFKADPTFTRHSTRSIMEPAIEALPQFAPVDLNDAQPGDLLGLQLYRCVDHLGVLLSGRTFCHVLMHKNTCFDLVDVPPWRQRIVAAWRPIEL